jgi:hypothetical protein
MDTPLIKQLVAKVDAVAAAARALLSADEYSKKRGIPGMAKWHGFNESGSATVKIDDQIYIVNLVTNTIPPIGTKVYVDESFNVMHKNVKPKEPIKIVEEKKLPREKASKRKKRTKHPVFLDVGEIPSGATWLVYPEILKRLEVKSEVGSATNPEGYGYNLFLNLYAALALGSGVLIGIMLGSLEESISIFEVDLLSLPHPNDHDAIPSGLSGDDYTKFVMIQGMLDSASIDTPLWLPIDGLYAGIGGIFTTSLLSFLINNKGGEGVHFTEIKAINPDNINGPLDAALYMFEIATLVTGKKIQASIIRANAVYPGKRINVNVHGWPALVNRPIDPANDATLPNGSVVQFQIPDDIPEWEFLSGAGPVDYGLTNGPNNFAYDLVPIHRLHEHLDNVPLLDHTKFASYERNNLYLHYVLITYAPWTGLGEDLRINYYNLNLKFALTVDDTFIPFIEKSYTLNPASFNLPEYFEILGDNILEMKEFPLQAGDRNEFTKTVTFKIEGIDNVPVVQPIQNIFARKGSSEKYGYVSMLSEDSNYLEEEDGVLYYHPHRAPHFTSTELAGFVIHPRSGRWAFDQNYSTYAGLTEGQVLEVSTTVFIRPLSFDSAVPPLEQQINITIVGSVTNYVSPYTPSVEAFAVEYVDVDEPPSNEYDPEAFTEDSELLSGALQEFEEVEVFVPFPSVTNDGNVFGWQGQEPVFSFEEVGAPVISLAIPDNNGSFRYIQSDANYVSANDFTFSFATSDGPVSSTGGGYIVKFKPKNKDYDFLYGTETLHITYSITARYNEAPYVGNFENLNEFQRKSIRGSAIYHADPLDWRYEIFNPVSEHQFDGYIFSVGDSVMRDTTFPELNISVTSQTISADYLHEFKLNYEDPKDDLLQIDQGFVYWTSRLRYEFDEEAETILFYDKDAEGNAANVPLDSSAMTEILFGSNNTPKSTHFSIEKMFPSGFDRTDTTGASWRKHIESKEVYAYLIYGYLPV